MLSMLLFSAPAAAQRNAEWVLLGETRVGLGIDRDSIRLADRPKIDGLRLRLSHRGTRVLRMVLNFDDGSQYEIPSEELAAASSIGESYEIDLPPFGRRVTGIDYVQRRLVLIIGDRPTIGIYGRILAERRMPPDFGPGWDLLGTLSVDMGVDRDTIELGYRDGTFTALGLSVAGRDIDILGLRVTYGNGESERLNVQEFLRDGQRSRPIDLAGRRRFIRRIDITYAADRRRGPRPEVAVFGKRAVAPPKAPDYGRGWEVLGTRSVDLGLDSDVIEVGRREGAFDAIGIAVDVRDINIRSLEVTYGNGESEQLPIRAFIRAGERSRPIELSGPRRFIRRIELVYGTDRRRGPRAEVTVYGRKARAIEEPLPPPRSPYGRGWDLLGVREVDMGLDRDVIEVGRGEGPYSAIGLSVRGRDIDIVSLRVVYGNGSREDLPVRSLIQDGRFTRPIDLAGTVRGIRRIELVYASDRRRGPRAEVAVWGKVGQVPVEEPDVGGGILIPPSADFGRGWEILGTRSVDLGIDRDVIEVGIDEGGFTALGLSVLNRDIEVLEARVVYGNGESDRLNVRTLLVEGSRSRAYDLRGERRAIRHVELTYISDRRRGPRAEVLLWGKLSPSTRRIVIPRRIREMFRRDGENKP
jgi:hypothetical protein